MADPPRMLAAYTLRERMAVGGMAEIFRATRSGPGEFEKSVAIKLVLPDLGRDPQFVEMLKEEARLGGLLSSPRLVQVFDFGQEAGTYYLVMEYVDGVDLGALLATEGALPVPLALHLGSELCAALADLHGAIDPQGRPLQIVHRDVNPGNVLLSIAGDVKLGDFGIAKARARSLRTERGAIKGKLAYLSPEQARGDQVDARADLYAVGLILFEALVGERYLIGDREADLLQAASQPRFRPPSTIRPELPAWLDELLGRLLDPEPARRFPDARQLREALLARAHAADPAELRRRLGELAGNARRGERGLIAEPAPRAAPAAASEAAGPHTEAVGPRTEVLRPEPERARRWSRWASWSIAIGLLASAAVTAALVIARLPQTMARAADARAEASLDRAKESTSDSLLVDARLAERSAEAGPATDGPARRGRPRVPVARASTARRDGPLAAPVVRRTDLGTPPAAVGLRELRQLLASVDRTLAERGLIAEDVPGLVAEREALASSAGRGHPDPKAAARLLARAAAFSVDRAFIDAKLARITRRLGRASLEPTLTAELKQRAGRALSYAVTGRYNEANRELNAIHQRLEPR